MTSTHRSRNGCWTCRLRRKKCFEDGPPCLNCVQRDVQCHGYGPKPDWKDKGERERQEAVRLSISSKHSRRNRSSFDGVAAQRASLDTGRPQSSHYETDVPNTYEDLLLSPLSPGLDSLGNFDLDFGGMTATPHQPILSTPATAAFEVALTAEDVSFSQSSAQTQAQHERSNTLGGLFDVLFGHAAANEEPLERQFQLSMRFLDDCGPNQGRLGANRGCLLFLLTRSQVFLQTSLSMAAHRESLLVPAGSEAHMIATQDAQTYRDLAMQMFSELENSPMAVPGEDIIGAIQLAHLEAGADRLQECRSYLDVAAQRLVDSIGHQTLALSQPLHESSMRQIASLESRRSSTYATVYFRPLDRPMSDMETKTLYYFCSLLLWNDAISSSISRKTLAAADAYRKLLSTDDFSEVFRHTHLCEGWAVLILIDVVALDCWKRGCEEHGKLSLRELLTRASRIEALVEEGISRVSKALSLPSHAALLNAQSVPDPVDGAHSVSFIHLRTYIFLHAVLVDLQVTVSGAFVRAPEVQDSIDRAAKAWTLYKPSIDVASLAWPFLTVATVATGDQREFFRAKMADAMANGSFDCQGIVESCWRAVDGQSPGASERKGWKELALGMNANVLFK